MAYLVRAASPEREAELDEWYRTTHFPDVLQVPGIESARRLRSTQVSALPDLVGAGQEMPGAFLVLYEIESDDLDAPLSETVARINDGRMPVTDALVVELGAAFETVDEQHTA
jgi:hypothetical protein